LLSIFVAIHRLNIFGFNILGFGRVVAFCLLLTSLSGCGGSEFGATVTGVVTLDGKSITPGFVTFAPEDPAAVPAVSDLDAKGRFTLTTSKKPGLVPGKYRVAVQSYRPPGNVTPGQRIMTPSERLIPDKYFSVDTSGLQFTVNPGANTINLELSSQ
jgi:hypothetical protein